MEGNLRVRKIRIRNLGTIDDLTLLFNKRIALVEGTAWREILLAFRIICGGELSKEETDCFKPGFEIEAELLPGGRRCHVIYETDSLTGEIRWKIRPYRDGDGHEVERNVRQYLRTVTEKRRLRTLYDPDRQRILKRFSDYETEEEELRERIFQDTSGLSCTSVFRELLKEMLEQNSTETDTDHGETEVFFRLNRFWEALEEARGPDVLHGPLILTEKLETIEQKGTKEYLREMRKYYEGQLIIIARQGAEDGIFQTGND